LDNNHTYLTWNIYQLGLEMLTRSKNYETAETVLGYMARAMPDFFRNRARNDSPSRGSPTSHRSSLYIDCLDLKSVEVCALVVKGAIERNERESCQYKIINLANDILPKMEGMLTALFADSNIIINSLQDKSLCLTFSRGRTRSFPIPESPT
jgi:hypothetical protein